MIRLIIFQNVALFMIMLKLFEMENYLTSLSYNLDISCSNLRTSNHKLSCESERYYKNGLHYKWQWPGIGWVHFTNTNPALRTLSEIWISLLSVVHVDNLWDLLNNKEKIRCHSKRFSIMLKGICCECTAKWPEVFFYIYDRWQKNLSRIIY